MPAVGRAGSRVRGPGYRVQGLGIFNELLVRLGFKNFSLISLTFVLFVVLFLVEMDRVS